MKGPKYRFTIRDFNTAMDTEVKLHPSSINSKTGYFISPFLIFHELVSTSNLFVRDSSMITPFALLLFGGKLQFDSTAQLVEMDSKWLRFRMNPKIGLLLRELRRELDLLLRAKIENPGVDLSVIGERVVKAIVFLIEKG